MAGIIDLAALIQTMEPVLHEQEYVFCTVTGRMEEYIPLNPIATFQEREGLTLIVEQAAAEQYGLEYEGPFHQITLSVHSSLDAVGLTAAVARCLTEQGISANVVAAFYHDHIFVQTSHAQAALNALTNLAASS
ncbi:ACT domain-containing protein [Pseudoalteromonas sp. OOF1S-7]|uniref:ACT domain-containing protein n=1 Tax=Pseudoalteromonas sp. OOF1S-7 TaxID=2917757 RepID=UPI001EF71E10|nr:ACT domain-containing protein [Pseudoalteromonas sp. OOF1S-7]MCG7535994.1 ACT domain-containing protein [Pseudoalteromonas sp. OOF1S-7]